MRQFPRIEDSFISVILTSNYVTLGKRRMVAETLTFGNQANCRHEKQMTYTQRKFDILNGFEITATKCYNCHKILELKIRKLH